jgi:amino acid transporter
MGTEAKDMTVPSGHLIAQERKKLRKVLHRFDLVFFTIAAFISLDTIAITAAYGGGQTFFWLAFLIVVYLIPYGMIMAEMGSTFPVEGGPYVWTRMAFGRLAGSFTAVLYWASNPVWIGGTLAATVVAAINSLILEEPMSTFWSIVVGLAVVWVTVMLSMIEMKYGKWTGIIGTVVRLLTLFIFLGLVVVYLFQEGKPAGTVTVADLQPTIVGFLAVIGLLQFVFVGFELSSGAAEEMTDPQKDVPKMILRSGVIAALITGSMILGVLLVMDGDALSTVAGFTEAYASVSSVLGGAQTAFNWFICALIILTIISAGGVWQQGGVRIQAMAGLDGAAPLWFGKFSKQGTPLTMNILSAIIGSVFVIIVFWVAQGSLADFFAVMVSVIVSVTAMMYLFQMPAIIRLRKKYPHHHRPFRLPGGKAFLWLCVIGAETIVVITTITLLWPGLLDNLLGQPYSIEDNWGVSRVYFETVTLGSVGFLVLLAVVFWVWGRRNIRKGLVGENDLLAIDPEVIAELAQGEIPGDVVPPAAVAPADEIGVATEDGR